MKRLLEYLFHFFQGVFQLGSGGGVKARVGKIAGGGIAERDRLESLETDVCIDPKQQNNGVNTMQHQINSNIAICIVSGIAKTWIYCVWMVIDAPGVP